MLICSTNPSRTRPFVLKSFSFKEVLTDDALGGHTRTRTAFEGRPANTECPHPFHHLLLVSSVLQVLIRTLG